MGCGLLCGLYLMGIFNALVLETLHGISHSLDSSAHHHSYMDGHGQRSSLEAMSGHSHQALEELRELLQLDNNQDHGAPEGLDFQLDKHWLGPRSPQGAFFDREAPTVTPSHPLGDFLAYLEVSAPPPRQWPG